MGCPLRPNLCMGPARTDALQFVSDSAQSVGNLAEDDDQAVAVLLPLLSVQPVVDVLSLHMVHQRSTVPLQDLDELTRQAALLLGFTRRRPLPLPSFLRRRTLLDVLLSFLISPRACAADRETYQYRSCGPIHS